MNTNQILTTLVTIVLILFVYYFATFQKRRQTKEIKKMQEGLKKGDKVVTYSGLSGIIEEVLEDRVVILCNPDKTKISIEKWAVAGLDDRTFDKETKA